jgi:antitoxin Phd
MIDEHVNGAEIVASCEFARNNPGTHTRMNMDWKLAEAKTRLNELVSLATTNGPQTIRHHGDAVVVVSETMYRELTGERPSLKSLLLNGPTLDDVLSSRDPSPMRTVEL